MNLSRKDVLSLIKEKYPEEINYDSVMEYINLKTYECPEHLKMYTKHDAYTNLFYLYSATVCYFYYSRAAIGVLFKNKEKLGKIDRILDLGAGNGLTSMKLSDVFNCKVYYNQLDGIQKEFAREMFIKYNSNCTVLPEDRSFERTNGKIDLVFASDFFEHLERPINYLENVIRNVNPKYIVTCNAFTAPHPDHIHPFYFHKQYGGTIESIEPKKISRRFNAKLRYSGYEIYFKGWSGRPTVWKKFNEQTYN